MGEEKDEKKKPIDACCRAMTADCLACEAGVPVEEWCTGYPHQEGCLTFAPAAAEDKEEKKKPIDACCLAMTADCLACKAGVPVEEWCTGHPHQEGCLISISAPAAAEAKAIDACCLAMTADCLACEAGVPVEVWCTGHPHQEGCLISISAPAAAEGKPIDACCLAMTADCLACEARVPVEVWCTW